MEPERRRQCIAFKASPAMENGSATSETESRRYPGQDGRSVAGPLTQGSRTVSTEGTAPLHHAVFRGGSPTRHSPRNVSQPGGNGSWARLAERPLPRGRSPRAHTAGRRPARRRKPTPRAMEFTLAYGAREGLCREAPPPAEIDPNPNTRQVTFSVGAGFAVRRDRNPPMASPPVFREAAPPEN